MPRIAKIRLNKGDKIVLANGDQEQEWRVERGVADRLVAVGESGTMHLTLNARDEDVVLRIEVTQKDSEGREYLTDSDA